MINVCADCWWLAICKWVSSRSEAIWSYSYLSIYFSVWLFGDVLVKNKVSLFWTFPSCWVTDSNWQSQSISIINNYDPQTRQAPQHHTRLQKSALAHRHPVQLLRREINLRSSTAASKHSHPRELELEKQQRSSRQKNKEAGCFSQTSPPLRRGIHIIETWIPSTESEVRSVSEELWHYQRTQRVAISRLKGAKFESWLAYCKNWGI